MIENRVRMGILITVLMIALYTGVGSAQANPSSSTDPQYENMWVKVWDGTLKSGESITSGDYLFRVICDEEVKVDVYMKKNFIGRVPLAPGESRKIGNMMILLEDVYNGSSCRMEIMKYERVRLWSPTSMIDVREGENVEDDIIAERVNQNQNEVVLRLHYNTYNISAGEFAEIESKRVYLDSINNGIATLIMYERSRPDLTLELNVTTEMMCKGVVKNVGGADAINISITYWIGDEEKTEMMNVFEPEQMFEFEEVIPHVQKPYPQEVQVGLYVRGYDPYGEVIEKSAVKSVEIPASLSLKKRVEYKNGVLNVVIELEDKKETVEGKLVDVPAPSFYPERFERYMKVDGDVTVQYQAYPTSETVPKTYVSPPAQFIIDGTHIVSSNECEFTVWGAMLTAHLSVVGKEIVLKVENIGNMEAKNVLIKDSLTGRSWEFDEVKDGVVLRYGVPWGVYEIPPVEVYYEDGAMKKTLSNSLRLKEKVVPDITEPISYIIMFVLMFLIPIVVSVWEVKRK
ncbi:hypothetical protein DRN72_04440 [Methanosarcinales archaeon]|nr:MAG: hypothetical protein DRN72_04440 [Methanosarcinales archaeon]